MRIAYPLKKKSTKNQGVAHIGLKKVLTFFAQLNYTK